MTPHRTSIPCDPEAGTTLANWSEDPLTARARTVWSAGDYIQIARGFTAGGEEFVSRLALKRGEKVLDVACGGGQLAIPAARRGARVTGIDIAANLIAQGKLEARSAGLDVAFEVGDAQAMPYQDGQFDTTISMFGAMFTPRPMAAACEMLRVTREGGRLAMANWTPDGFVGQMLRAHTAIVPPAKGVPSPLAWGDVATVRSRFGDGISALSCSVRTLEFHFPFAPEAVVELFATCYGPTVTTLAATDPAGASELRGSLTALWREHNVATDGTTIVSAEYLDVQARVA